MTIRAKMKLSGVFSNQWGGMKAVFNCQYDSSKEEDKSFQKATPSGSAEFQIDNSTVFPALVIGKDYYFDISPCE